MLVQLSEKESLRKSGGWPRGLERSQIADAPDAADVVKELGGRIKGEVRFDYGSRAMYSTDASNYRQVPIGVVIPRDSEDVVETVAACRRHGLPVLSRGGGTSLAGQCCNTAVVIDMSKYMHRVLDIDPDRKLARVQPGCVLDTLRSQAEEYHLTFGPDPATHNHCALGGMVGNNACGMHAQMAGRTSDNIEELEILTYDGVRMRVGRTSEEEADRIVAGGGRPGEIYSRLRHLRDRYAELIRTRYPKLPRRISGYNLDDLLPERGFHVARALVGSESTCVTVLEVVGNLVHSPPSRTVLVLGYPDVFQAGDHVPEVVAHGPIACEGIDARLIGYYEKKGVRATERALLPDGHGWLILEFGGETEEEAAGRAREVMDALKRSPNPPSMKVYDDPDESEMIWELREGGLGATAFVPGERDTWPGWEDSAVPPDKVGDYLRELRKLFAEYGYDPSLYGHFGQGCIHCRVQFDLVTKEGIEKWRSFINKATDLVVGFGGSLSGEHGDGQARGEFLRKMFGEELLSAFREFKSIWDPDWKMNPGKVVEQFPIDANLRLGVDYNPPQPRTHFHYPDDDFKFSKATLRCVGVGKCRREGGGTMCPSYMVTREEMHSTRGRTHLLFEMMQGDPLNGGWRDQHVKEALDLCLSCKGCKGDCPVAVDVTTYKAEFLSHYYHGRLRPRHAFASGLIMFAARAASLAPGLANFFTQTPGFSSVAKLAAGYSQKRSLPPFARQTFRDWFRQRPLRNRGKPPVILWADTFNNYFTPEVARAAVEVLEDAGFQVKVPVANLCCGRPLYDYGMLDTARSMLMRTLGELRQEIRDEIPIVGLEPSCVSVFRDEMPNLLYGNHDASRMRNHAWTLGEFLNRHAPDYRPPQLRRHALVHGHCHRKSVLDFGQEKKLMKRMGLNADVLDSGCCGMAGSFGYEEEHYDVGLKCGERVLLPAVRQSADDTIVIADGFSFREMIRQETDRQGLHLAQVLQMALRDGPAGPERGVRPEQARAPEARNDAAPTWLLAGAAAAGIVMGGAWVCSRSRGRYR